MTDDNLIVNLITSQNNLASPIYDQKNHRLQNKKKSWFEITKNEHFLKGKKVFYNLHRSKIGDKQETDKHTHWIDKKRLKGSFLADR